MEVWLVRSKCTILSEAEADREAKRQRGKEAERQRGKEAKRQRGKEAKRQRGREAERQMVEAIRTMKAIMCGPHLKATPHKSSTSAGPHTFESSR